MSRSKDLEIALAESLKLQVHYAKLLNMHDGGERKCDFTPETWIARLRELGTIPPKVDLATNMDPREQLHALIEASEHFNSDETYVIGRDHDEKVLSVAVVTIGGAAIALAKWLEKRGVS